METPRGQHAGGGGVEPADGTSWMSLQEHPE